MTDTIYTDNSKVNSALVAENERLQARLDELEGSEMACIKTLVNIRFACGDNGKRMQGELVECIAELRRKAVSVLEWIKCSDRLPAEYDGDFEGLVWVNDRDMTLPKYAQSRIHWSRIRGIAGYTHWMPTGFRRPQPPKQEGE